MIVRLPDASGVVAHYGVAIASAHRELSRADERSSHHARSSHSTRQAGIAAGTMAAAAMRRHSHPTIDRPPADWQYDWLSRGHCGVATRGDRWARRPW